MASIDWTTLAQGGSFTVGLLIEGLNALILPPGVTCTSVTTSDTAWGIAYYSFPVKNWLAFQGEDGVSDIVIDESMKPWAAGLDVAPISVYLHDTDGEVTDLLGSRDAMPRTRLTANVEPGDNHMHVETTSPMSGLTPPFLAFVGKEVVEVGAVTGTRTGSFDSLTRGLYGTADRRHLVSDQIAPCNVYGEITGQSTLPSLVGRRATLWGLRFTSGTVAGQCDLLFDGIIGPGIRTEGAGYSIPIDHASTMLAVAMPSRRVRLSGYSHPATSYSDGDLPAGGGVGTSPLWITWKGITVGLQAQAGAPDEGGWHPTREAFLAAFQAETIAAGAELSHRLRSDGTLEIVATGGGAGNILNVIADWDFVSGGGSDVTSSAARVMAIPDMPAACVWLDRSVVLSPTDLAQVPTVPTDPADSASRTRVWWTLSVPSGEDDVPPIRARITAKSATDVTCQPIGATRDDVIVTEVCAADLALYYESDNWWSGLRYGVWPQIAAVVGIDHAVDSVDWTRVSQVASVNHGAFLPCRKAYIDGDVDMLGTLSGNAIVAGLCLSTWHGRISIARIHDVSSTEDTVAEITPADTIDQAAPAVEEVHDGIIAGYQVTFPNGDTVNVTDASAEDEGAHGDPIKVEVPEGALRTGAVLDSPLWHSVLDQAMAVTGPWRRSYRQCTVDLPATYGGVQLGQVVRLTEWLTPTGRGTRGLSGAACTVLARQVNVTQGLVTLTLRVSSDLLCGYAPEVLVKASGISGKVLSIDTTTAGAVGFASDLMADGTARVDGGASCFVVGDVVQLVEIDAVSPAAAFTSTITGVNATAVPPTITLNDAPSAGWVTLAAAAAKVMLTYQPWTAATRVRSGSVPGQHEYGFVADDADLMLGASDLAKVFAG